MNIYRCNLFKQPSCVMRWDVKLVFDRCSMHQSLASQNRKSTKMKCMEMVNTKMHINGQY